MQSKLLVCLFLFLLTIETQAQTKKSNLDLLQGKWQAVDDKSNFLIFEKNHRKEKSAGSDWDDVIFVLSSSCMNESNKDDGTEKEIDKYISSIEEDLCWYIIELSQTKLSLAYQGRGNTLIYKKVIPAKK
jgi:hypothetical protein